jgi:integrase
MALPDRASCWWVQRRGSRRFHQTNHHRRVIRGIFGTHSSSPALAWAWKAPKVESEGKLRFYTPEQVGKLLANAYSDQDVAIFTLATEAGPRLSEIRALKVCDVDFAVDVVRLEDGYTTHGGFAGNKGRRTRSAPMSANVRRVLWPLCEGRTAGSWSFSAHPSRGSRPVAATSIGASSARAKERVCPR